LRIGDNHAVLFIFRGKITSGEITISMPDEIEEVTWMHVQEAEDYIHITSDTKGLIERNESAPYLLRKRSDFNS
jgi:8-oxo-dGTP diphosphatase